MRYVLWGLQILLGLFFLASGVMKVSQPYDALAAQLAWVSAVPEPLVRFIGLSELLGGLGLILPAAMRILPWLTPLAGAALALDMVLAAGFHLTRGEFPNAVTNLVLALLAGFIAYGRWRVVPIRQRGHAVPSVA